MGYQKMRSESEHDKTNRTVQKITTTSITLTLENDQLR